MLFVGNISWDIITDDTALLKYFEEYGEIKEAKLIIDKDTGRSKGFGFVTYVNREDALNAIESMSLRKLGGRLLKVMEARPQRPRPPRREFDDYAE